MGEESATRVRLRSIDGGKAKKKPAPSQDSSASSAADRFVQSFDCSDTGNAERLAARFGQEIRFVPAWGEHLIYMKGRWRRDTAGVHIGKLAKDVVSGMAEEAKMADDGKAVLKWRRKSASRSARSAMIDLVKHEDNIAIEHTELDPDHDLFNCLNGTLDLRTGKLREFDPKDLITKQVPVEYKEKAKAPRWTKFLQEVVPDKAVREFLHRWCGYCLTGDVSERVFVILLGEGRNGKSKFIETLEWVMGTYATTAAPTLLMAKDHETHPTEVADLFGARLALSSETKKGGTFDEERVKRLTGGDTIKARRMREDNWSFEPTHKLMIASNHKPRVKDATDSFWDRVAMVPFSVRIADAKVDRGLKAKLRAEREGILCWLVEGCRKWRAEGLNLPPAVKAATAEYRSEEDILGKFLEECCDFTKKNVFTRTNDIMAVNKNWADALHLYQASSKELAAKLRGAPYNCVQTKDSGGNMGWKGVRLTKELKYRS